MNGLNKVKAAEVIHARFKDSRPTIGICIGMQVLFADSDENGIHSGINMWPTSVRKLQAPILPHMGWNSVEPDSHSLLFAGVEGESFYFVHSYYCIPKKQENVLARTAFGNQQIVSGAIKQNIIGLQFHPEKSGKSGKTFLGEMIGWAQA